MADAGTISEPLSRSTAVGEPDSIAVTAASVSVKTTHRIEDVEAIWRAFAFAGIESPGQSYDFIRLWTIARNIPAADQLYVTASLDGRPLALLPLCRRRRGPIRYYSWFPGRHVGCNAPLVDAAHLATMSQAQRRAFWQGVTRHLRGADVVYLRDIPERSNGIDGLFDGLGRALPVETLYRSSFASWDEANATQRSKSRRKHDRQQGEKLEALGEVSFEVVHGGEAARPVLDVMFHQRAERFRAMGIKDPFAACDVARFYNATVAPDSGVAVKLHVLRLNGDIVAVRYNIVHGDRLFCLISSMSDDPGIQGGSPGKQCLLRVMQSVFDEGFHVFDMGAGFTDEKRHWCNEQLQLASHYVPLTASGRLVVASHAVSQAMRARIKANERLLKLAKGLRGRLAGHTVRPAEDRPSD